MDELLSPIVHVLDMLHHPYQLHPGSFHLGVRKHNWMLCVLRNKLLRPIYMNYLRSSLEPGRGFSFGRIISSN